MADLDFVEFYRTEEIEAERILTLLLANNINAKILRSDSGILWADASLQKLPLVLVATDKQEEAKKIILSAIDDKVISNLGKMLI